MGISFLVGGIITIVVVMILFARQREKKRTEEFQRMADELNWPFHPTGDDALLERLDGFQLFSKGRSKKMTNLVYAQSQDGDVALFGYRYTTGHGKNQSTHRQNVAYFQSSSLNLPKFSLRPEHIFHKIGGLMGYQDIDFLSHPEFSKKYLLRGENVDAISDAFSDEALSYFESQKKLSVEADGDRLIYFRAGKRIKADEVLAFLQEASEVFKLFKVS